MSRLLRRPIFGVWACRCTLWRWASCPGDLDFQDLSAFCAAVLKPVQFSQPEWHPIDESFKAILRRCLAIEKSARPASMELLQSAFFKELMESENEDNDDLAAVCRTRSV